MKLKQLSSVLVTLLSKDPEKLKSRGLKQTQDK